TSFSPPRSWTLADKPARSINSTGSSLNGSATATHMAGRASPPDDALQERHHRPAHGVDVVEERPVPEARQDVHLGPREVPPLLLGVLDRDERVAVAPHD